MTPKRLMRFHAIAAWVWMAIGIFGLVQFGWWGRSHPAALHTALTDPIASSIPVLFFISVYANVVGHWSSNQAARTEVKQDRDSGDDGGNESQEMRGLAR